MENGAKGNMNEAAGKAKTAMGDVMGDEKLAAEGEAQQAEGAMQKFAGEMKTKIDGATDAVKKAIDDHTK